MNMILQLLFTVDLKKKNVKGDKGEPGDVGSDGLPGSKGEPGDVGPDGLPGSKGFNDVSY